MGQYIACRSLILAVRGGHSREKNMGTKVNLYQKHNLFALKIINSIKEENTFDFLVTIKTEIGDQGGQEIRGEQL